MKPKKILGRYVVPMGGKRVVLNPKKDVRIAARKVGDRYVLCSPQGNWINIDESQYRQYKKGDFGEKLAALMEKRGLIVTEDNASQVVRDGMLRKRGLEGGPSLHIIVPTDRCNQKCRYCHASASAVDSKCADMDEETVRAVVDFVFQSKRKYLTIEFQGGESTLNLPVLKEAVRYAKEKNASFGKNVRFVLATNLTNMDEDLANYISRERLIVSTSLDGPRALHDANRKLEGGGATYDRVVSWVEKLRAMDVPVGALMVTTKQSLGLHKEIVDEYVARGMEMIQIKPMSKLGYADSVWDSIGYDIAAFCEFYEKAFRHIVELNKKGVMIKERHAELALTKLMTKRDPNFTEMSTPCGAAISQMAYAPNGDIYSCDEGRCFSEFKLGNVHEDEMEEVLSSRKVRRLVNSSTLSKKTSCSDCAYMPFCGTCPVLNHACSGGADVDPKGTDRCVFYSFLFDLMLKLLREDEEWRKVAMKGRIYG